MIMKLILKGFTDTVLTMMFLELCSIGSTLSCAQSLAQSPAHARSAFAIIDPLYSVQSSNPPANIADGGATWIYGAGELESWRLKLLMARKDSAGLNVGYPGVYHTPYDSVSYRLYVEEPVSFQSIAFRVVGWGKVLLNGVEVSSFDEAESLLTVSTGDTEDINEIQFDLVSATDPPALLIEDQRFSTLSRNWQWRGGNGLWEPAFHFPQTVSGIPPHLLDNPTVTLRPVTSEEGLYDFGRELLAFVIIRSEDEPIIRVGESETEALDVENTRLEQSLAMKGVGENIWRSRNTLAFRYLYIEGTQEIPAEAVSAEALFYPTSYKGAFACSDSTLTRIWMNSGYTLRVNMHDFLLDGIKRDRLPWSGDLTMSLFVNAYTFHEPELVRRSLVALNNNGIEESDVNGIIDYSLAWIVAQDKYQLYFGDSEHLEHEWGRIKETIHLLLARTDENGFLNIDGRTFIDWVNQEKWTAVQVYWWWAQQSGINLAKRVGDDQTVALLTEKSEELKTNLISVAWDDEQQVWRSGLDPVSEPTRHPNFMAVVSGLASPEQYDGILNLLQDDNILPVGTPYMAGFENMAVSRMGNVEYMLNQVTEYWGAMLDEGATTFWEAYDANEEGAAQYSFYRRPYGKSLAHAWSAGPAYFLPSEIFGLRPLEDGWKRFSLDVNLGYLEWASASVPTKYGPITVDANQENVAIIVPPGTVMQWKGRTITGPAQINEGY
ncbi:hypothetical protein JW824_01125 [bacterium]|nr:hypothetical protein [bacterium]